MPVVSRKMTPNGESHKRFIERNERKEIRMATMLKKGAKAESAKPEKEEKAKKGPMRTPVSEKDRDGDRFGLTYGLRLNETFVKVLRDNEDPKKGHKSDEELIQFFAKEFENRHNKAILYNVREIRWRYNVGKLTPDADGNPVRPEVQSNKYDEDGNMYERRKTSTGMSEEEKAMKIEERREVEGKRREEEDEKISGAEDRLAALRQKIEDRRAKWEEKNGPLQETQPVKKADKAKVKVKAK